MRESELEHMCINIGGPNITDLRYTAAISLISDSILKCDKFSQNFMMQGDEQAHF